jgi:O-antigen/teichoic acid export membrane protein
MPPTRLEQLKSLVTRLLRKSQHYTKTDMVSLAKGTFWLLTNYALLLGTGIITTIALANLLPKDVLGSYQYILAVAGIVSVCTLSGLGTAITRAVAQGHEGVLRSGLHIKLKWSVSLVLISGAIAIYYFWQGNDTLALSFLIVGAFTPLIESFKLYESYLHGKEAFKENVTLGMWRKPLPLIATLSALFCTDNVVILVFTYFASNALSIVLVYYKVIQTYRPPFTHHAETLAISKHLSVLRFAGALSQHFDKVILWQMLGGAAVASFTLAQLATRYSGGLLNTVTAFVLPKVSKRDLPSLQATLPRKVFIFTLLMTLGAVIYILIAPLLFAIAFPAYPESIALSQVLAISLIFIPRSIYEKVLIAHKQIRSQYILGFLTPLLKCSLLVGLIPAFGIWGAVYAILITELVVSILSRYFFVAAKPVSFAEKTEID